MVGLPALLLTLATPETLTSVTRRFINEEAIYLITPAERARWSALQTEGERRLFAEAFWQRRDPNPLTPENEFREAHVRRIEAANRLFPDEGLPGWKTDRGRSYILYGPPDQTETQDSDGIEMESLREQFQGAPGRSYYVSLDPMNPGAPTTEGRQTWYYRHPTGGLLDHGGRLVFLKNARGRWLLSTGGEANPAAPLYRSPVAGALSPPAVGGSLEPRGSRGWGPRDQQGDDAPTTNSRGALSPPAVGGGAPTTNSRGDLEAPGAPTDRATGLDLDDIERRALDEMVLDGTFRAAVAVDAETFYLPHAPGRALVGVALRVDPASLAFHLGAHERRATLRLFGAVVSGFGKKAALLKSISTPVEITERPASSTLVFSMELPPGRFQMYLGVLDTVSLKMGSFGRSLDVPDYGSAPRLGSILLARGYRTKMPEVRVPPEAGELDLGTFALAVEPHPRFDPRHAVEVFFQVGGLNGPFEITYQVFLDADPVTPPIMRRSGSRNVSQSLPLESLGLAPGAYELRVSVEDEPTHRVLSTSARLVVER